MDKFELTQDGITVIGECNPSHEHWVFSYLDGSLAFEMWASHEGYEFKWDDFDDIYYVDDYDDKPITELAYWIMATYPGN